ncbi:PEP-CTERM/exosortase system-associated acyltransferase [Thiohalorhabdus methylotrophus]|uniref:Acyl-homoserine-lactone synthase n=1 Tax=Thiohalorhabdus methylotrophus TaxID=3242694 RepID=A0ABV4TUE0_9GAMM
MHTSGPVPNHELYEVFHSLFEVVPADTAERIAISQALRYQVYCLEQGFERPEAHPDERERDPYDGRSVHALVRCRRTGQFAGSVRLVLSHPQNRDAPFPIEEHCLDVFHRPSMRWELPRHATAEISRFAISRRFTRVPHITIGLFAGIVQMSVRQGITDWYAVMEPALLRLLTRFGIRFQPIGGMVAYHGRRRPTRGLADRILAGIHQERPEVWEVITDCGRMWPLTGESRKPGEARY